MSYIYTPSSVQDLRKARVRPVCLVDRPVQSGAVLYNLPLPFGGSCSARVYSNSATVMAVPMNKRNVLRNVFNDAKDRTGMTAGFSRGEDFF